MRSKAFSEKTPDFRSPLSEWVRIAKSRLAGASGTAGLDAQVLVAHILGRPRSWILAHPETRLSAEQAEELEEMLAGLERGQPLAYALGEWEFYGLKFYLNPAVLIPRPETELMVETALEWLKDRAGQQLAADVGTGSGCIAIALAANQPDMLILASDLSMEALHVAERNIHRHRLERNVKLVHTDLLPATSRHFDLICANLPYIPSAALAELQVGKWEPALALNGGTEGLDLIQRLLAQANGRLASGGLLLLEIEARQGKAARKLAQEMFPRAVVAILADLAKKERLITIQTR